MYGIIKSVTFMDNPEISTVEKILFKQTEGVTLSSLYDVMSGNTHKIKGMWERDLSVTLDEETREEIWSHAKKISISTRTKCLKCKTESKFYKCFTCQSR